MKQYLGRHKDLKKRMNSHLIKLTGIEKDYFATLTTSDLLNLKTLLSDINNSITLGITIDAAKWIIQFFEFKNPYDQKLLNQIDKIKPNANGFDINISEPCKIIAEVKCNIPVNQGAKFGANQWNSILDDAIKLKSGKGNLTDTTNYYKFIFLLGIGERSDEAIDKLLQQSKGYSNTSKLLDRHLIKKDIVLITDKETKGTLSKDKIYLKKISIEF